MSPGPPIAIAGPLVFMRIARRLTLETDDDRRALGVDHAIGTRVVVVTEPPRRDVFLDDAALPADVRSLLPTGFPRPLELGGRTWSFDERPWLLGIVNVTPDSFSDAHATTAAALDHGRMLIDEGADWLDIGGESTRPGALAVTVEEECRRVVPVVAALAQQFPKVPLSVDTSKVEVARRAIDVGASMVNDVTGLADDALVRLVAETNVAACVMHMQGTPRTMQLAPTYVDVVHDVVESLSNSVERAVAAGVTRARLLIDPGIGFGKSLVHNLTLLRHLEVLRVLGLPVVLGTSRKSFLGTLTSEPVAARRVASSVATAAVATVQHQAQVLRVHDVKATREAVVVAEAIRTARGADRP